MYMCTFIYTTSAEDRRIITLSIQYFCLHSDFHEMHAKCTEPEPQGHATQTRESTNPAENGPVDRLNNPGLEADGESNQLGDVDVTQHDPQEAPKEVSIDLDVRSLQHVNQKKSMNVRTHLNFTRDGHRTVYGEG